MARRVFALFALVLAGLVAGCFLAPRPLAGPPATAAGASRFDLEIDLAVGGADRAVQFNGGSGALQNDIAHLVVGLFDNGSGIESLGYLATGSLTGSQSLLALDAATPSFLLDATDSIRTKLGTAGTGNAASGLTVGASEALHVRRYLIRDLGSATDFASRQSRTSFKNLPVDSGDGKHSYLVFAAAYGPADEYLGYTEAAVSASLTQAGRSSLAEPLKLNLSQGVFQFLLAASPSLVPFAPDASSSYLTPLLAAVREPLAAVGGSLYLDGNLTTTGVTVNFPGGVSAGATIVSRNRAKVTVPAGATAGDLTFTVAGKTSNALPFRAPTFAQGLGSFSDRLDQDGASGRMARLATPRLNHTSATIGDYLYVLGGQASGGTALDSIERAKINADGSLTHFEAAGTSLATPRFGHTSVVVGAYLYVIGGHDGTDHVGVERAQIQPGGGLGSFAPVAGVTLKTLRHWHSGAIVGNHYYVIGGAGASGQLGTVERAPLEPDGTLGDFAPVAGSVLDAPREFHTSAVVAGNVYVLGGNGSAGPLNSIEKATIGADGGLGDFETVVGQTLTSVRYSHTCDIIGDGLYVAGGVGASGYLASVERATIAADGSLGTFATVTGADLRTARRYHTSAIVGNYHYVIGGFNDSYLGSVERASIDASSALGTFSPLAGTLVAPRAGLMAVTIGRLLYVLGGNVAVPSTVERANVNADGSLGTFQTVNGIDTPGHSGGRAAVIGNRLYLVGGNGPVTGINTVSQSTIGPSGDLGPFSAAPSMIADRTGHALAVVGNYLYAIGGHSLSSVERAAINADNTLGTWGPTGITISRYAPCSAVIGDKLYVIGGHTAGATDSILASTINADGSIGTFAQVGPTLVAARYWHSCAVVGQNLYVWGGNASDPVETSVIERAAINPDGTLGSFAQVGGSLTTLRGNSGTALIGNTLYVLGGGVASAGTNLSGIEKAVLQ